MLEVSLERRSYVGFKNDATPNSEVSHGEPIEL